MVWVLIIYLASGARFGGTFTTAGPFQTQSECVAAEHQVHFHYSRARDYYADTVCVSGAR